MSHELTQLKAKLAELSDWNAINALLGWDQSSVMPVGGGEGRGRQMALMSKLTHEKMTDPEIGHLLEKLQKQAEQWDPDSVDSAIVRVTAKDYADANRVPADFVGKMTEHINASYMAWAQARPANDFQKVVPFLEKTVEMSRQYAGFFPQGAHVMDALIDMHDSGMDVATLRPLFKSLRDGLIPMVYAISKQEPVDDSCFA